MQHAAHRIRRTRAFAAILVATAMTAVVAVGVAESAITTAGVAVHACPPAC